MCTVCGLGMSVCSAARNDVLAENAASSNVPRTALEAHRICELRRKADGIGIEEAPVGKFQAEQEAR